MTGAQKHPVPLGIPPVDDTVAFSTGHVKVAVPLASTDEKLVLLASEEMLLVLEDSAVVKMLLLVAAVVTLGSSGGPVEGRVSARGSAEDGTGAHDASAVHD